MGLNTIRLKPGAVTLLQLQAIVHGANPVIDESCKAKVNQSAAIVAKIADGNQPVYGINTGFGKLASVRIAPKDTTILQRNLIVSHCAGTGAELPSFIVRLMMALKLISLAHGASGVRWQIIELLQEMLAKDVLPIVPSQGSVGASGDLAPLAHMTAVMIGEGEAHYQGKRMCAAEALAQAGIQPVTLGAKEGLAMINGTQTSTALGLVGLFRSWHLVCAALVTGGMALDALMGSPDVFHPEIHQLRGQRGQIMAAGFLYDILQDSEIRESHRQNDVRMQDPYCLRCQPQIIGACLDVLMHVSRILRIEANAVTDNPLIVSNGEIVSGGNFHAEPVGFAADQMAMAISEIGAVTQRRISTLVDPALSYGLPAFLSPEAGLNSGFMIAEVTSAALMSENKALANPRVIDSTPTSANQEDHVSMACHAAHRLLAMNDNLEGIIAIELLCAAQGIDLRAPFKTSQMLQTVIAGLRTVIPPLQQDRMLASDIEQARKFVKADDWLKALMLPLDAGETA